MSKKPVATLGSNHQCPMYSGSTPHVGGPITKGEQNILINGKPVATIGSMCTCNAGIDTIVTGNPSILANGKPISCIGDMTAHGGTITAGESNVLVSSSSPQSTVVMPIDQIPFPDISFKDRIGAAFTGNTKMLKQAETNQQKIKELAEQQEQEKKEKGLPKLQGEIIFINGYLSDFKTNSESHWNAIMDLNPDKPGWFTSRGENTNEYKRTDHDDYYTAEQREKDLHKSKFRKIVEEKFRNPNTLIFKTPESKYYGYWNDIANDYKATETYAKYFNAEGRVHYINGSHGLGSSGAHRVDHGIALGYEWARHNWLLIKKEKVDAKKEESPQIESYSPHYKPVTIVGHSQGACMAAGVKLGIIKYANEMGWKKVAINTIFLGVHQPKGLYGKNYDSLIKKKTQEYMVYKNAVLRGKNEDSGHKFLSAISELYSPKYKKVFNKRGLFEHVKAICYDWNAYKSRAVQFTFPNDRGDLVTIDGDIPEIKSACHPKRDKTLFSAEYFHKQDSIPSYYQTQQNKKIIDLSMYGAEGGYVVVPPYVAEERYDYDALEKLDSPTVNQQMHGVHWKGYSRVAIRWGVAMNAFKLAKSSYQKYTNHKFTADAVGDLLIGTYTFIENNHKKIALYKKLIANYKNKTIKTNLTNLFEGHFKTPIKIPKHLTRKWRYSSDEKYAIILYNLAYVTYQNMLLQYAPLQSADLYAHFAPVGHILHTKLLQDKSGSFNDQYGNTSIFERIKNAGKDKFYRMVYKNNKDGSELTEEQKREQEKTEVETKLIKKLINSSIADTEYINNVIKAYVHKKKSYESKLYDESKNKN
ncbi:PAAR domain-containing protein [Tenacibaculum ascidiaceicola]|uniref:PAAR domain-containing protein n=1 Tax=Tenacibaculum ascidiaceicola TaxID=1699411 RepID=UPI0039EB3310